MSPKSGQIHIPSIQSWRKSDSEAPKQAHISSTDSKVAKGLMTSEVLKDFLLYFLPNRTGKWMDLDTLLQNKGSKELTYVTFLLEKRAEVTNGRNKILRTWLDRISTRIRKEYKLRRG